MAHKHVTPNKHWTQFIGGPTGSRITGYVWRDTLVIDKELAKVRPKNNNYFQTQDIRLYNYGGMAN